MVGQAKLIHSLSSPPAAVFTAKIMVWGTNGIMVNPFESSKIVSKLSGVSKRSQRMHKLDI